MRCMRTTQGEIIPKETRTFAHCSKIMMTAIKGKSKGKLIIHYKCNYCTKKFQGPSSSTVLKPTFNTYVTICGMKVSALILAELL